MGRCKDVLIVLGCSPKKDGRPSDCMISRVRKALQLYRRHNYSKVLLSGGPSRYGVPEAAVMRVMLLNFIPPDRILVERRSRSTVQNALFCWGLLNEEEVKRVTVVTSAHHIPRAKYIFRKMYAHMGVSLAFEAAADTFDPIESVFFRLKEFVLLLKLRVFGFG
jgi:uncharacterized SAM-binding protein YcdF (DUF218 family)